MATGRAGWWGSPSALVRTLRATALHASRRRRRRGCVTSPVPGCRGGSLGVYINKYKHAKTFKEACGFFISINISNSKKKKKMASYLFVVLEGLELVVVVGCFVGVGAAVGVGLDYENSHWSSCEASSASVATQGVDHR